jgi:cytochrome c-type biogenesis protein CcmE
MESNPEVPVVQATPVVSTAPPAAPPPAGSFSRPGSKVALAVAIVAAIILLTVLLPASAPGPKYTDVHEITASPATYDGKTVAVVGGVQSGSVSVGSRLAFNLTDYASTTTWLRVVYDGGMDANFGEGKTVLTEGVIHSEGGLAKLYATKISIGCPTDYTGTNVTQQ